MCVFSLNSVIHILVTGGHWFTFAPAGRVCVCVCETARRMWKKEDRVMENLP